MQSKDRTFQVVAIVGLIIGAMALTVGFAAFTTTLTIQSTADVTPASTTLNVVFSSSNSSVATSAPQVSTSGETGASGGTATLTGTNVSGIVAHFTKPGQTVTYSWYVYNNSDYTAYLKEINFKTVSGSNPASFKVCQAKTGSDNQATLNVDEACSGITLTLNVHGISTTTGKSESEIAALDPLKTLDTSSNKYTEISVAITYAAGSAVPDGDIEVAFGDIELKYSSVAPSGA